MKENGPGGRTWLLVVLLVIPGALFVGREMISHYHRFFDPRAWFRKR